MSVFQENDDTGTRYIIVSGDSHVGPSLEGQLRAFCPRHLLKSFDDFVREAKETGELEKRFTDFATDATRRAYIRSSTCPGLQDPQVFLRDMDSDGVAASVIFAGGGNNEPIPWIGGLLRSNDEQYPEDLNEAGARIWNEWLADFTRADPRRLLGVAQIPFRSLDAAIREVRWAHDHGLRALNFPAPRLNRLPYNDPFYEPFWDAVEETGLPLVTHCASGDLPDTPTSNPGYFSIFGSEVLWLSRRGLAQLIFGGVFERHPSLKVVFTEQRSDWVGYTLRDFDSLYFDPTRMDPNRLPRRPSEYWESNGFVAGSFMAPHEAAQHEAVGPHNLIWGSDYPHPEGTWPCTQLALRNTFAALPEPEVRKILGSNALPVYGLNYSEMREIADRIGPTPKEIAEPLAHEDLPEHTGWSFREFGAFA